MNIAGHSRSRRDPTVRRMIPNSILHRSTNSCNRSKNTARLLESFPAFVSVVNDLEKGTVDENYPGLYTSNQGDVTFSIFFILVTLHLYMFRAFLAHHHEPLNCIGSRWYNNKCAVVRCGVPWEIHNNPAPPNNYS
jgi:hypothetical protein